MVLKIIKRRLIYSYASIQNDLLPEFILSWKSNFISWQNFYAKNKDKGIILRYEDLVNQPKETYLLLIKFLSKHLNFSINEEKLFNSIESVKFDQLSLMEKKRGFIEKSKKSKYFFRKGETKEWKKILDDILINKINDNFKREMTYLNYI